MDRKRDYEPTEAMLSLIAPLFSLSILLALTLTAVWVSQPQAALAANLTVTSVADAVDAVPGDGICNDGTGACTLRAAIMEANALAGADTIILPAGIYVLTVSGLSKAGAATGDLDIIGDLTITGAGPANTIIDGGGIDRVFTVLPQSTVHLARVTVRRGSLTGFEGGGILNAGTLTLVDSAISNNTTAGSLGGGGIFNRGGTVVLIRTTVANNAASNHGGGILNFGKLTLTNSTISNNTVGGDGGGILNSGAVTLINSTVSNNTAAGKGGGIANSGTAELTNTIIANSTSGGNCVGTITSLGHNLASDNTCGLTGPTDRPNTNPLLGPLADNGGPTEVHALLTGNPAIGLASSPAIDAGDDSVVGPPLFLSTDQRGKPRFRGQHVDIGAYETEAAKITVPEAGVPSRGTAAVPIDALTEVLGGPLGPVIAAPLVPGDGLGAYQFQLGYNPNVMQVLDVLGGDPPFDGVTAKNINNQTGIVKWTHFQATDPIGPVGTIKLTNVVVQAIGGIGSCSPLGLVVIDLVNTNGEFIPNKDVDGQVCIVAP